MIDDIMATMGEIASTSAQTPARDRSRAGWWAGGRLTAFLLERKPSSGPRAAAESTAVNPRRAGQPVVSLLIAAIIPVLLFGACVGFFAASQRRDEARKAASETVRHVADRVASEMQTQLQVVEALATSTALDQARLDRFYEEARRLQAGKPLWSTVELTSPTGTQVINLLRDFGADLGPTADRGSFDEVVRTRRPTVGGIGPKGRLSGQRLVALRAPVIREGKLRYVLTVSFAPNAISSILNEAGAPDGWVGVVVDANGNIIARTVAEEQEIGRPASAGVRQAIVERPNGFYMARTLEGVEVETFYRTLPDTGGWSVHFGVPSEMLNKPVSRSLMFLAGGGVVSVGLGLGLAALLARDLAQRRRDEDERSRLALALSEKRGALAVEAANLGTWRWTVASDEITGSERCWRLLGRQLPAGTAPAFSTRDLMQLVHEDDRASIRAAVERCSEGDPVIELEYRVRKPDGTLSWVRASGRSLPSEPFEDRVYHGVIADIDPQKRAQAERRDLLQRIAEAQENEQRRIARELHDQVGQTVTGLALGLKSLERQLDAEHASAGTGEQVRWLRDLTQDLGRDIHRAAVDLRPTALDDLGLAEALVALVSNWGERFGIAADIQFFGRSRRLTPVIETIVYRVAQEALTNVLKHSKARNVSIFLDRRSRMLRLIIEDDGVGFDPEVQTASDAGRERPALGLSGIRERLELVGGTMSIESAPREGATLYIHIPLPSSLDEGGSRS